MSQNAFSKDPQSVEWFGVDWTARLQGDALFAADTILSSDWTVPAGLTEEDDMAMAAISGVTMPASASGITNITTIGST